MATKRTCDGCGIELTYPSYDPFRGDDYMRMYGTVAYYAKILGINATVEIKASSQDLCKKCVLKFNKKAHEIMRNQIMKFEDIKSPFGLSDLPKEDKSGD